MTKILTNILNRPTTLTLVYRNSKNEIEKEEVNKLKTGHKYFSGLEATIVANLIGPYIGRLKPNYVLYNSIVFDIESIEREPGLWQVVMLGTYDGESHNTVYSPDEEELAKMILDIWPYEKIFAVGYNISSYDFAMIDKTIKKIVKSNSIIKSRIPKFFSREYGEEIYGQASIDLMNLSLLSSLPSHSLEIVLESLKIPIKKYDQRKFLEMLYNQNWDLIIEHNRNDNYGTYKYLEATNSLIEFILRNSLGNVSYALSRHKIAKNMLMYSLSSYIDNPLKRVEVVYDALKKHNLLNSFNKQDLKYTKKGKEGTYKESYILFKHLQFANYIIYADSFKKWAFYYLVKKLNNFAAETARKARYNPKYFHILSILNSIVAQITKPLYLKYGFWRNFYNANFSSKARENAIYDDFYIAVFPKIVFHKYSLPLDNFVCGKTPTGNVYYEANYKGIVLASKTSLPQKVLLPDYYSKNLNKARIDRARGTTTYKKPQIRKDKYELSIRVSYKNPINYTNPNSYQAIMAKQIEEEAKKYGLKLKENEPLIIWLGKNGKPILYYNEDEIDIGVYRDNVLKAYEHYNFYRKNTLDNFLS